MANAVLRKNQIPFTQVANSVLYDPTISPRAKFMYAYLYSKPDGWEFFNSTMEREIGVSVRQIREMVNELIKCGLIRRNQINDNGKFGGMLYEIIVPDYTHEPRDGFTAYGKSVTQSNIDNINNTETEIKKEIKKEIPQRGPSDFITSVELFDFWNRTLLPGRDNIGGIIMFDEDREKRLHKILDLIRKDQKLDTYHDAFEFFKQQVTDAYDNSSFLQGRTPNNTFKFDLDFCLQRKSFIRMVEGKYEH